MSLKKNVTTPSGNPLTRHPHHQPHPAPATSPGPCPPRQPSAHPTRPTAPPPRTHHGLRQPGRHRHLDPPSTLPAPATAQPRPTAPRASGSQPPSGLRAHAEPTPYPSRRRSAPPPLADPRAHAVWSTMHLIAVTAARRPSRAITWPASSTPIKQAIPAHQNWEICARRAGKSAHLAVAKIRQGGLGKRFRHAVFLPGILRWFGRSVGAWDPA